MKKYKIPVEWGVYDVVEVEAESFADAVKYAVTHKDEIPLGTTPEYIDGSYKINSEDEVVASENDENYVSELVRILEGIGYGSEA